MTVSESGLNPEPPGQSSSNSTVQKQQPISFERMRSGYPVHTCSILWASLTHPSILSPSPSHSATTICLWHATPKFHRARSSSGILRHTKVTLSSSLIWKQDSMKVGVMIRQKRKGVLTNASCSSWVQLKIGRTLTDITSEFVNACSIQAIVWILTLIDVWKMKFQDSNMNSRFSEGFPP